MKVKLLKKFRKEAKKRYRLILAKNGYAIIEHCCNNYVKDCGLSKEDAIETLKRFRRECILDQKYDYVLKHIEFEDV